MTLLDKVKANLILEHDLDDILLSHYITTAKRYAEGYQHKQADIYEVEEMSTTTEQAVVILATHLYESRDGSTGGFFSDNVQASKQVWDTIHRLLMMEREWQV